MKYFELKVIQKTMKKAHIHTQKQRNSINLKESETIFRFNSTLVNRIII